MEDRTENYPNSTTFKKSVVLPKLDDWYMDYYHQLLVDDIIFIIIKEKGTFMDSTQKLTERKVVLTRSGKLLIYTDNSQGFMLDFTMVQSETSRTERYLKDGIYNTTRCHLKLKFSFGSLNIFLIGDQISKWRPHLDNLLSEKGVSSERTGHNGLEMNGPDFPKPYFFSKSQKAASSASISMNESMVSRPLKSVSSFVPSSSTGPVNYICNLSTMKLVQSKNIVNDKEPCPLIPIDENPTLEDDKSEVELKSDTSAVSLYSMDSERRRRRTNSRSRLFHKSQENLQIKTETPFIQLEEKLDKLDSARIPAAGSSDRNQGFSTKDFEPAPPKRGFRASRMSLMASRLTERGEPVKGKYGTLGMWAHVEAKNATSTSNLKDQIKQ